MYFLQLAVSEKIDDIIVAVRHSVRCDEQILFLIAESRNELISSFSKERLHSFDIQKVISVFVDFDIRSVSFSGKREHQIA